MVSDSAASRKSLVGMALSLLASTGTSTKDLCRVSNQVPPAGKVEFDGTAMVTLQWQVRQVGVEGLSSSRCKGLMQGLARARCARERL